MKKLWITLLVLLCFISGCSIVKVSDNSVDDIFNTILYVDNKLSNTYMEGYEFYLPQGVKIVDKEDYNLRIKDNKNYYYLYIDTIAYHYKVDNAFTPNYNHFYSKKILYNGKIGYVDIVNKDDYYFVVLMYNYAKIESFIKKSEFSNVMLNMCRILSSIKYNDSVINRYVGNNKTVTQEERFDIFDSNIENDNFLKYESEYGTYKEKIDINKDNDIVDVEETIE